MTPLDHYKQAQILNRMAGVMILLWVSIGCYLAYLGVSTDDPSAFRVFCSWVCGSMLWGLGHEFEDQRDEALDKARRR